MSEAPVVPVTDMDELLGVVARSEERFRGQTSDVDLDCSRVARELRQSSHRVVGLLPASSKLDVQPLAASLALALSALEQRLVLVFDPERSTVSATDEEHGAFFARPLGLGACMLAPWAVAPPGAKVEGLRLLLDFVERLHGAWGHVLIDLRGCTRPGELLGALRLLDGVIVVGRAGDVRASALRRAAARIPPSKSLGVLLVE